MVGMSGTSMISSWASTCNFLSSLAPQARVQARADNDMITSLK